MTLACLGLVGAAVVGLSAWAQTPESPTQIKARQARDEADRERRAREKAEAEVRRLQQELKAQQAKLAQPAQPAQPAAPKAEPAAAAAAPAPRPAPAASLPLLDGVGEQRMQALQRDAAASVSLTVVFSDGMKAGGTGPAMVVVPGGRFTIGSADEERRRYVAAGGKQEWADWERPLAGVAVPAFALGQREVTRGEFAAFVKGSGHQVAEGCWHWTGSKWEEDKALNWRNPGYAQTDAHPVVCVAWQDAQAYAKWLAVQTGQKYRLASEAEWEMAARAGTTTRRYWGDDWDDKQGCTHANVADKDLADKLNRTGVFDCRDGHVHTAPVATKPGNALGLHDMLGNVNEWVEDCFSPSYQGMPMDGKARQSGCEEARRVLRGGSWDNYPWNLRAANRSTISPDNRNDYTGFRIARTF